MEHRVSTSYPFSPMLRRRLWIVLIVLVAAMVRLWAAWQLPPDADEPVYLKAGKEYAELIKAGNWQGIINYEGNREHPALVKLVYAAPYLIFEPKFGSTTELFFNRIISATFGTLAVLVLTLMDPIAGAFLALDSMVIKYTSQVYLEAIPLFASLFSLAALRRSQRRPGRNVWFWLSAVALGMACAGKYLYVLTALPVFWMMLRKRKTTWQDVVIFGVAALFSFWVFNPSLWIDPFQRLWQSLTFHTSYSGGQDVLRAGYPWYQPFLWVTSSVQWHAQVFFFPTSDILIVGLLLFGVVREWRERPWALVWMGAALLTLLLWPTKWPQYTLILVPAMCLVAANGLRAITARFKEFDSTWHWAEAVLPRPGKLFWVALGLFLTILLAGKLWYEFDLAEARSGWLQVKSDFTPLPSNTVNDILGMQDGKMVIATSQGVVVWQPDETSPWGGGQQILHPLNSGLVNADVRCLLVDKTGTLWFGTQAGLSAMTPDGRWMTFSAMDMGLESEEITSLVEDALGKVWLGSKSGVSVFSPGKGWQALTRKNSGLAPGAVFDIAVQANAVWFATQNGVIAYYSDFEKWQTYDLSKYGLGWVGISDLYVDQKGILWVATLGDGVSKTDGETWITYRSSNSNIPGNAVSQIFQTEHGNYWFGMAYSTEPGGFLTRFDGENWQVYSVKNSGFSGGEPSAMAVDDQNRLWIGTRMDGISIFHSK